LHSPDCAGINFANRGEAGPGCRSGCARLAPQDSGHLYVGPITATRASVGPITATRASDPPRAARATPRRLLTPLAWISLMMGRTLAANASAPSLRTLMDAFRAAARRGPPSWTPRRLAAAKAALVRGTRKVRATLSGIPSWWPWSVNCAGVVQKEGSGRCVRFQESLRRAAS
jgi:hypothetical protein